VVPAAAKVQCPVGVRSYVPLTLTVPAGRTGPRGGGKGSPAGREVSIGQRPARAPLRPFPRALAAARWPGQGGRRSSSRRTPTWHAGISEQRRAGPAKFVRHHAHARARVVAAAGAVTVRRQGIGDRSHLLVPPAWPVATGDKGKYIKARPLYAFVFFLYFFPRDVFMLPSFSPAHES